MNIFRITTITFALTLLVACGGGGGGGSTAATGTPPTNMPGTMNPEPPPANPLTVFMPTADSSSIQAVQGIVDADGTVIDISDIFESGNLNGTAGQCSVMSSSCTISLLGATHVFRKSNADKDISLIHQGSLTSQITEGITIEGIEGITLARGNLKGTRRRNNADEPVEFDTFAGWLDDSIFGTIQMTVGATGSEQYRFISYTVGEPTTSNPAGTGSATWEGAAVASIKADREFIRGDATITIPNLANADVDLRFDNWRDLDNEELSNMAEITYEDLPISNGAFSHSDSDGQAEGRFYGTNHNEVGGFFNTMEVTGAFGGTKQ